VLVARPVTLAVAVPLPRVCRRAAALRPSRHVVGLCRRSRRAIAFGGAGRESQNRHNALALPWERPVGAWLAVVVEAVTLDAAVIPVPIPHVVVRSEGWRLSHIRNSENASNRRRRNQPAKCCAVDFHGPTPGTRIPGLRPFLFHDRNGRDRVCQGAWLSTNQARLTDEFRRICMIVIRIDGSRCYYK